MLKFVGGDLLGYFTGKFGHVLPRGSQKRLLWQLGGGREQSFDQFRQDYYCYQSISAFPWQYYYGEVS